MKATELAIRGGARTAEQDWFYVDADMRCDRGAGDSAEDTAGGFEVSEITPQEKSQLVQQLASPMVKVVHLVHFAECNVTDDPDTFSRMSIANLRIQLEALSEQMAPKLIELGLLMSRVSSLEAQSNKEKRLAVISMATMARRPHQQRSETWQEAIRAMELASNA